MLKTNSKKNLAIGIITSSLIFSVQSAFADTIVE